VKACPEYDVRLSLHAAGALAPAEAEAVSAHLAACSACREEAFADAAVLAAVRLPPVTAAEREALRELPARTVGAFRALERGRVRTRRALVGGFAAVAAALLAVVLTTSTPTSTPTATATPTWQTPDLDGLWDDTDVLALDAAAADDADALTATDVTLAAWDDAGF
jgi:anti-sigma factor RsiW